MKILDFFKMLKFLEYFSKIFELKGNEKRTFPNFENEKGMKKSIPTLREREPKASIPRNDRGNPLAEKTR